MAAAAHQRGFSDFLASLGGPIAYYASLARLLKSVKAAVFLAQLIYWTPRANDQEEGWVYKSVAEWEAETGLTYKEQRLVRATLKALGVIEERASKEEHRIYFRVNATALDRLWDEGTSAQKASARRTGTACPKGRSHLPKGQFDIRNRDYAETTAENTTAPGVELLAEKNLEQRAQAGAHPPSWPSPEALVALYHVCVPQEHPRVRELSEGRRKKAQAYLKQFPDRQFWVEAFGEIRKSAFLGGRRSGPGHEHFRADFDWLLTKGKDGTENIVKVAEGRYRDQTTEDDDDDAA